MHHVLRDLSKLRYRIYSGIFFDFTFKNDIFELYCTLRHIFKFMNNNFRSFEAFSDFKEITKKYNTICVAFDINEVEKKKVFSIEKKFKYTFLGGLWVWNNWNNTFLGWFLLYWTCFGTGFWYTSKQKFKKSRFVVFFFEKLLKTCFMAFS